MEEVRGSHQVWREERNSRCCRVFAVCCLCAFSDPLFLLHLLFKQMQTDLSRNIIA